MVSPMSPEEDPFDREPLQTWEPLPCWHGSWYTSTDGAWQIQPLVAKETEGYLSGYFPSCLGGDNEVLWCYDAHASKEEAIAAAKSMALGCLEQIDG